MKGKSILEIKNEPSVINYIELLQENIARMSNHSGVIKASMCVIYTVLVTILIAVNKISDYWWLAIVITIIGAVIDSYYLAIEKIYVTKYNKFFKKLNDGIIDEKEIYDMKPRNTEIKAELLAMVLTSLTSFSVYGFYLLLIIISIFVKFV